MKKLEVAIFGAGRLAEVLMRLLEMGGAANVRVWARREEARAAFAGRHPSAQVHGELGAVAGPAEILFFAVPAQAIEDVAEKYAPHARGDHIVAHATRGAVEHFVLPHQLIRNHTCVRKIAAIGGPLHGRELASGRVVAAAVASRYDDAVQHLRTLVDGTPVRVHGSRDVIGVEVAGAISNVAALAAGMVEALELGETARGVILTRGLAEAQRLGLSLGAEAGTFAGVAGVGDLIPRKVTSTERHHKVGAAIAQGQPVSAALEAAGGAVEGLLTARAAVELALKKKLRLPLIQAVDAIVRGEAAPREALEALLHLDLDDLAVGRAR